MFKELFLFSFLFYIKFHNANCDVELGKSATKFNLTIINGWEAVPNQFPWLVSLRGSDGSHTCGGSLVHRQFVLTAAHCIDGWKGGEKIIVGLHDRNIYNVDQVFYPSKLGIHANYKSANVANGYDIAMIKLAKPVQLSSKVSLINLPIANSLNTVMGQWLALAGWGRTNNGQLANKLQYAYLKVSNNMPICKKYQYNSAMIVCLFDDEDMQSQCSGDSGGSYMFRQNSKWYLYGITSFRFGSGTCIPSDPSFATSVPSFVSWINNIIKTW
jgi:secreted trypsin-like serine protease